MSNTKQSTDQCKEIATRSTNHNNAVQPFAYLQKNMMDQMDQRRAEWEKEVERMAEDFFQVKLSKPESESNHHQTVDGRPLLCLPSSTVTTTNGTATATVDTAARDNSTSRRSYDDSSQPEYYRDEDQVTWCRLRFDVSGYDPGDISVRVEGNRKLIVCARHVQAADAVSGGGSDAVTRQMSKTVDVPRGARPDRITSYLSRDGYLYVIAPLDQSQLPDFNNGFDIGDSMWKAPRECEFKPIHQPPEAAVASHGAITRINSNAIAAADGDDVNTTNRNVVRTDDGDLMLKIVADLGRSDYEPDDVTIRFYPDVVRVQVSREQVAVPLSPTTEAALALTEGKDWQQSRAVAPVQTLRREFVRDFDLPSAVASHGGVHGPTARAALGPDGRLWIGASLELNADPAIHRRVAGYIAQMMPRHGRPCRRLEVTG